MTTWPPPVYGESFGIMFRVPKTDPERIGEHDSSSNNSGSTNYTVRPQLHKVVDVNDNGSALSTGVMFFFCITLICGALGVVVMLMEGVCMVIHRPCLQKDGNKDTSSGMTGTATNL